MSTEGISNALWKEIQSDESNTNINYINKVSYQKRLINAVDFTDISDTTPKNTDTNDKTPKNLAKEMF